MAKTVKVVDKGYAAAIRALHALDNLEATIGLHAPDSPRNEPGLTNVALGFVHEFGANIQHPGGTPYMVTSVGGSSRSGGMVGSGAVTFLKKGDPRAIGVTRAHTIRIPERSFMRSSFDKNVQKYQRATLRESKKAIMLRQTPEQAIGRVGEIVLGDIIRGINRGIAPPLKQSTIRRKRSSKPLIDTGQLKQALKVKTGRYWSSKG
jgi:hypothetical protein